MSTVRKRALKHQRERAKAALQQAARELRHKDAVTSFVDTMLTEDEQVTIGRRLLISHMILAGKTQAEIRFELGVSPNTFTRTRAWLTREIPEYGKVLEADKAARAKLARRDRKPEPAAPFTFASLRQQYPTHFLLFNLASALWRDNKS